MFFYDRSCSIVPRFAPCFVDILHTYRQNTTTKVMARRNTFFFPISGVISLLLLLLFALLVASNDISNQNDVNFSKHFGSKTPYKTALQHFEHQLHHLLQNAPIAEDNHHCSTRKLFMLVRHGTRLPTLKHMKKYTDLSALLTNWTNPFSNLHQDEGLLTKLGEEELFELGERVSKRFLNNASYHPRKIHIRSSQSIRAMQSAHSFAQGAFGIGGKYAILSTDTHVDVVLRFHENCPVYASVKKKYEMKQAKNELLLRVTERIKRRLFLGEGFTPSMTSTLWSACKFEAAVFGRMNHACGFLSSLDAQELETVNDIEDYFEKSHGREINWKMACNLGKELLTYFASGKSNSSDFLARFYFGHAETVMPFVASLGLFKQDEESELFDLGKRKWRSGAIVPFAANVALVLKECKVPDDNEGNTRSFVHIYHNERLLKIVPLEEFPSHFHLKEDCDFHDVCHAGKEEENKKTEEL